MGSYQPFLKNPSSFEEALRIERDETSAQGGGRSGAQVGKELVGFIHSSLLSTYCVSGTVLGARARK